MTSLFLSRKGTNTELEYGLDTCLAAPLRDARIDWLPDEDAEIDRFVASYKAQKRSLASAEIICAAWKCHKGRRRLLRFRQVLKTTRLRCLRNVFLFWRHWCFAKKRDSVRRTYNVFKEWREIAQLTNELFFRLSTKLNSSFADVEFPLAQRFSIWSAAAMECAERAAKPTMTGLLEIVLRKRIPLELMRWRFIEWNKGFHHRRVQREDAITKLTTLAHQELFETENLCFKSWHSWTYLKQAVTKGLSIKQDLLCLPYAKEAEYSAKLDLAKRKVQLKHRWLLLRNGIEWWRYSLYRNTQLKNALLNPRSTKSDVELIFEGFVAFRVQYWISKRTRIITKNVFHSWITFVQMSLHYKCIEQGSQKLYNTVSQRHSFDSLRRYTMAQKLLNYSCTLRIWQHRARALTVTFAWVGNHSLMWLAWCFILWKARAVRRLQWTTMLVHHYLNKDILHKHLVLNAWRQAIPLIKRNKSCTSSGTSGSFLSDDTDSDEEVFEEVHVMVSSSVSSSPWRPPITRGEILKKVSSKKRLSSSQIKELLLELHTLEYNPMNETVIPTFYRHSPDSKTQQLWSKRRRVLALWLSKTQTPDCFLWQKIVALKRDDSMRTEDWRYFVDQDIQQTFEGLKSEGKRKSLVKKRRTRRGAISLDVAEAESYLENARFHVSLTQAEQFLETKLHALIGIGGESTETLHEILSELAESYGQHHLKDKKELLAWFFSRLIEHDIQVLRTRLREMIRAQKMKSMDSKIHELAAAIHSHNCLFTIQQMYSTKEEEDNKSIRSSSSKTSRTSETSTDSSIGAMGRVDGPVSKCNLGVSEADVLFQKPATVSILNTWNEDTLRNEAGKNNITNYSNIGAFPKIAPSLTAEQSKKSTHTPVHSCVQFAEDQGNLERPSTEFNLDCEFQTESRFESVSWEDQDEEITRLVHQYWTRRVKGVDASSYSTHRHNFVIDTVNEESTPKFEEIRSELVDLSTEEIEAVVYSSNRVHSLEADEVHGVSAQEYNETVYLNKSSDADKQPSSPTLSNCNKQQHVIEEMQKKVDPSDRDHIQKNAVLATRPKCQRKVTRETSSLNLKTAVHSPQRIAKLVWKLQRMTSNNNSREKDISSQLKYRRLTGFLLQLIPPTSITKLDPDQSLHSVMGHQAPLTKLPLRHQRVHNSRRRLHRSWPITKRKRPIRVLQSPSSSSDEDTFRQQMRSRVSVFFIDSVK